MNASICPGSGAVEVVRVGVPFSRVPLVRESRLGGIACFKCASLATCQRATQLGQASIHVLPSVSASAAAAQLAARQPLCRPSVVHSLTLCLSSTKRTRACTPDACQPCHCVYVCVQLVPLSFSAPTSLDAISLLIIAPIELLHCH